MAALLAVSLGLLRDNTMAMIDTHRAAYTRPNGNITCGKRTEEASAFTVQTTHHYTVSQGDSNKICKTIHQVNDLLKVRPSAKVVKTTKTVTTETSHKRVK